MLSAVDLENKRILAFELKDEDIQKIKKQSLSCSCCGEQVTIKKGRKTLKSGKTMITHFSHLKDSDCPDPKESYEHSATKISIYNSLKNFGIQDVWLERTINLKNKKALLHKYLEEVEQNYSNLNIHDTFFGKLLKRNIFRPDVCFKYNNECIAVEIQKSYLPTEDFLLRTLFYKILNIKVLWIIPEDVFTKKSIISGTDIHINISNFHKELKKYYFGDIYCWDYEKSQLNVYEIQNITGYRSIGSMVDGEYGGQYFEESGGYEFTYKKLKKIKKIHSQNDIINKFKIRDIKKNGKYRILIDAKIWLLNK